MKEGHSDADITLIDTGNIRNIYEKYGFYLTIANLYALQAQIIIQQ